ncbi:MAG: betaine-aldehyde dehydrogenase [Halieaceae bacterium]|jgi:betaine-aldehyde dehydrogenase
MAQTDDYPVVELTTTLPRQLNFIDGGPLSNSDGACFTTYHPGTGRAICDVEIAGDAEISLAVESARRGFAEWSAMPAAQRGQILRRAAAILRERNDELAALETLDTGKAIAETSVVDVITGVEVLEYFAGIAQGVQGSHIDLPPEAFAIMRREPLGICAGIGAWNYPIQIALWKSAPALACGNAMIFKPAEQTPLTALRLAEVYCEAGVPPGVFNVVQGAAATGSALVSHPDIAKVTLTGSVETGKRVMAAAAADLKKVTLELGGKSPIVVFEDCNLEDAVNGAMAGNFYSTGQVCSHGTRVYVHHSLKAEFLSQVVAKTRALRVGNPFDPATQMGPLVSAEQRDRVLDYMSMASSSSEAEVLCGGEAISVEGLEGGYFVAPTVVSSGGDHLPFVQEEVFGPFMTVLSFESEEEVIARANNTRFGLAAAVFTGDFARAHRVANALQAGIVWINDYNITPPEVPFGGYHESGLGRENGLQAIEYYTQTKTIYANLGAVAPTY